MICRHPRYRKKLSLKDSKVNVDIQIYVNKPMSYSGT